MLHQDNIMSDSRFANPKIRCYLDFDGTMTKISGGKTISTALYGSLREDGKRDEFYTTAKFKKEEDRKKLLIEGLAKEEFKGLAITPEAVTFLHSMLEIEAEIIFISNNRKEYITDLLKYANFNDEEITKIKIFDVVAIFEAGGKKSHAIKAYENTSSIISDIVIMSDDSKPDFINMLEQLKTHYSDANMITKHASPGGFNWLEIEEEIKKKIDVLKSHQSYSILLK